jgi:hypothetical protein
MVIYGNADGISEETRKQIEGFLEELRASGRTTGDFSDLYAKYPKVRIGIRRALLYLEQKKAMQ